MRPKIQQRTRFFVAVEGESEQSFVAWLQGMASENKLPVHLDTIVMGGGGFVSMLRKAVSEQKKRANTKGAYKRRFLIVDEDRSERGDWSVEKLRAEAVKHEIEICLQRPNYEGLLYRMIEGHARDFVPAHLAMTKLKVHWPSYEKPLNAQKLRHKFSINDLRMAAKADVDLALLLRAIGLLQ